MAELVKKLYIKKDGNAVAHKIYSTAAEAGANYIRATVDGVNGYIPICAVGGKLFCWQSTKEWDNICFSNKW